MPNCIAVPLSAFWKALRCRKTLSAKPRAWKFPRLRCSTATACMARRGSTWQQGRPGFERTLARRSPWRNWETKWNSFMDAEQVFAQARAAGAFGGEPDRIPELVPFDDALQIAREEEGNRSSDAGRNRRICRRAGVFDGRGRRNTGEFACARRVRRGSPDNR